MFDCEFSLILLSENRLTMSDTEKTVKRGRGRPVADTSTKEVYTY